SIMHRVIENDFNVTFSGGDPMYQASEIIPLAKAIKDIGKNIWCYTGFQYEDLLRNDEMRALLSYIDVLVDGEFILSQRNTSLLFRGSGNQRLIDLRKTSFENIVLWESDF
ncbi:MAG: radical SAM protein, partial [Muribaculaceae bacterium]|nr:radical SAM protein [Muribaculaceae bacterium]